MGDVSHPSLCRSTGPLTWLVAMMLAALTAALSAESAFDEAGGVRSPRRGPGEPTADGPGRPILGFAIVAHHISHPELYLRAVDQIAALGANSLTVVTPMFQRRVDSTEIRYLPERCPTEQELEMILRRASRNGLHTTLQPIVLLLESDDGEWRGKIEPASWDEWWSSYAALIDRFAGLAHRSEVDRLCIGSELNSTEDQFGRWLAVTARAARRFDGELTYSANWDRYECVTFWSLLDVISVSAYFEIGRLAPEDEGPPRSLAEVWAGHRDRLIAYAETRGRPFVLGELGYPSLPWAAEHPWNYIAPAGQLADHAAQARCYGAFFDAWRECLADPDGPALGFCCYAWDPYHAGQASDTGYGVRGKPALALIRRAFARIRREASEKAGSLDRN